VNSCPDEQPHKRHISCQRPPAARESEPPSNIAGTAWQCGAVRCHMAGNHHPPRNFSAGRPPGPTHSVLLSYGTPQQRVVDFRHCRKNDSCHHRQHHGGQSRRRSPSASLAQHHEQARLTSSAPMGHLHTAASPRRGDITASRVRLVAHAFQCAWHSRGFWPSWAWALPRGPLWR